MGMKVAINGFGRIGRLVLRAILENGRSDIEVVAINDLADAKSNAMLFQRDSVHGRYPGTVVADGDDMVIDGRRIRVTAERDPGKLPHSEMGVDIALECTGFFTDADKARAHITAGAKRVLISAPGKGVDLTVVYGVNHQKLSAEHVIVSNASCTTNCLAPVAKVMHDLVGIERGLKGKLDGSAIRVPTPNVSLVDLTFVPGRDTSTDEVNAALKAASEGALKGILDYSTDPLVSIDLNHVPYSSTVDSLETAVLEGKLVRVVSWYDNEWGFSNRMADTAVQMGKFL
jgi:glyceraldehyde 3-phosphate dehydrogenase